MSNAVEDFLHALKRTINGDPYPAQSPQRYAAVRYRVADVRDPLQGAVLSCKYRIEARVGKGAMSSVYKATQEPIGRVVALKLLNHEYSLDPISVKRFNREAKIVSALKHPNILSIHDIGSTDTGQPFFVMEYLEGMSLEALIQKRGPIVIPRALPLFCQICDGLSYAHSKGLIHRDIKPANVMLVKEDDAAERVKLVDFGIVKVSSPQSISQRLTKKGEIWGSPIYMSPEQCMGNELDGRSDIYSLGLVMYEALLGVSAFKSNAAIGAIVSKQLTQMPPNFNVAAPSLLIPEGLEKIVFKCIQKSPDERFASMDELREQLDKFAARNNIRVPKSTIAKAKPSETQPIPTAPAPAAQPQHVDSGTVAIPKSEPPPGGVKISIQTNAAQMEDFQTARYDSGPIANPHMGTQMPPLQPQIDPAYTLRPGSAETPVYDDRTRAMNSGSVRQSGSYYDDSSSFRNSTANQRVPSGAAGLSANQIKIMIFGAIALLVFIVAATAGVMYFVSGDKPKTELPSTNDNAEKAPKMPFSAGPVHEDLKNDADSAATKNATDDSSPATSSNPKASNNSATVGRNPNTDSNKTEIKARHPVKRKVRQHGQQSTASNSPPADDEVFLERIHLRRRRTDATQQWLDIQHKVQER